MRRERRDPRQGELFGVAAPSPLAASPAPPRATDAPGPSSTARFADADDRRTAVTCFDRAILLVAGAGTGKTGTLTARILTWVLGPGWEEARAVRPEADADALAVQVLRGVVAITFTEAAAAEMSARVAHALAVLERLGARSALDPGALPDGLVAETLPADAATLHDRAKALRGALDHLGASTIHAFCRRLLAAHALEAGLDPDFAVDAAGTRVALAVREVLEEELAGALAVEEEARDLLELARRGRGPDDVERDLSALIDAGARAADFAGPALSEADCTRLLADVGRLGARLAELCAPLAGVRFKTQHAVRAAHVMQTLLSEPRPGTPLERFDAVCLALGKLWRDEPEKRLRAWAKGNLINAEKDALTDRDAFIAAAGDLDRALAPLVRLDRAGLEAAHRVAGRLLGRIEARLRASGTATFGDLLWETRALLRDRPEVAAAERRAMRQLLVDEFQDTDEIQCEIVGALGLEGEPGQRPCLFVVGDPKQSIFAWRNADLAAFDDFAERIERSGGLRLALSRNFRSVPDVLEEVERAVAPVMEAVRGVQPTFARLEPHRGARAPRAGAAVEHWVSWVFDETGTPQAPQRGRKLESYELEARALANDLLRHHGGADGDGLGWKDVGVIFRALTEIEPYLRELRRRGIPYEVQSDRKYYQRREVIDAGALVRCVLDPADHLALVTLLRSPLAGLPDAALLPLWERGFPGRMTALHGPDEENLAELERRIAEVAELLAGAVPGLAELGDWTGSVVHAVRSIARLRASFRRVPADAWLEELRALFLPEALEAARFLGSWRLANLGRFFRELLRTLEERDGDVQSLLRTLRANLARDDRSEAARPADSGRDAVKILTIHGAKGLEFRHVYLPQLHKGESDGEGAGFDRRAQRISYRLFTLENPAWHELRALREETEAAERVRLYYVALTRARDRLVVMGAFPPDRKARTWRSAQSFADLVEGHPELGPAIEALLAAAREGRREPHRDAGGALWLPAAWVDETPQGEPAAVAEEGTADAAFSIARVRADARSLAEARARAGARAARPAQSRPSEEVVHERAERRVAALGDADGAAEGASDATALGRDEAQAAGTAVHRALETLDLLRPPAEALALARERLGAFAGAEPGPDAGAVRTRALELWERFERGPLAARLFALAGHVVARELAVLLPPDAGAPSPETPVGFVAGAIDLLYRDPASGELVVVDHKTDRVESRAEAEARAAEYAPQGAAYVRAVRDALGLERAPRFELWFVHAGEIVSPGLGARG